MREKVIEAAQDVFSTLGAGHVESVYQNALAHELRLRDIPHQREFNIQLLYKKQELGIIRLDFLIGKDFAVELKAVKKVTESHKKQVRAYLLSSNWENGLLINFPPEGDEVGVYDESLSNAELVEPNCSYKGKAIEKIITAADEVAKNLGAEFFYNPYFNYYLKALKAEFRLCNLKYEEKTFELLYKDYVIAEQTALIVDKRYLLDVISKKELNQDIIDEHRWIWSRTGIKQEVLINICPDSALVQIEKFRIGPV